nr:SMI1/KNR4 family protein [Paenibacillus apiarius]
MREGYLTKATFTFNPPATDDEINNFINKTKFVLPDDYNSFLKICNGCTLFDHPEYGGEAYIYSLEEIINYTFEDPFNGRYKIANIYGDNIVIDFNRYQEGDNNYLMIKSQTFGFDECTDLSMNFEIWFDRYIMSQGEKFWDWPLYTAKNYYQLFNS